MRTVIDEMLFYTRPTFVKKKVVQQVLYSAVFQVDTCFPSCTVACMLRKNWIIVYPQEFDCSACTVCLQVGTFV